MGRADRLLAPPILRQEFYNATHLLVRRGLLPSIVAARVLARYEALPIEYRDGIDWVPRAYDLARRHRQSRIFDAIYYVCAEDRGAEMWTCDRKFVTTFGSERPAWLKLCPDDVVSEPDLSAAR